MAAAFVQGASIGDGTGTNHSGSFTAFPSANTAHNVGLAIITWDNTVGVTSSFVDDTAGNTWTQVGSNVVETTSNQTQSLWICTNLVGGANTVGSNFVPQVPFTGISFIEVSGVVNGAPHGSTGQIITATTATDSITSGTLTTLVDGCLIVGMMVNCHNVDVPTAGTGFTLQTSSTGSVLATETKVQSTHGSTSGTFTLASSGKSAAFVVALTPSVARPAAVVGQAAVNTPVVKTGQGVTPTAVAGQASVPGSVASVAGAVTSVTPTAVAGQASVPSLTGTVSSDPGPTAVAGQAAVGTASVVSPANAFVTPGAVVGTTSIPVPASVSGNQSTQVLAHPVVGQATLTTPAIGSSITIDGQWSVWTGVAENLLTLDGWYDGVSIIHSGFFGVWNGTAII